MSDDQTHPSAAGGELLRQALDDLPPRASRTGPPRGDSMQPFLDSLVPPHAPGPVENRCYCYCHHAIVGSAIMHFVPCCDGADVASCEDTAERAMIKDWPAKEHSTYCRHHRRTP